MHVKYRQAPGNGQPRSDESAQDHLADAAAKERSLAAVIMRLERIIFRLRYRLPLTDSCWEVVADE